jgi:2-amino-4-hydroxy-6-hydroxymethyldihydropteridine diphosphokinase
MFSEIKDKYVFIYFLGIFLQHMSELVYLSIGSNSGKREKFLKIARDGLEKYGRNIAFSFIYESPPWGFVSKNRFLNQCLKLKTNLSPEQLLKAIQEIEESAGRKRLGKAYSDRTIDIDILFFGDLILETKSLQIPHPLLSQRKFVLLPLNDIAPNHMHPLTGQTVNELLAICPDSSTLIRSDLMK